MTNTDTTLDSPGTATSPRRTLGATLERLGLWLQTPAAVWWTGGLVALVHLLPRVLLGTSSFVTIHDGLDSDFLYRVLLTRPGRMFDYDGQVPELLNGVPRVAYPTGASISAALFALLPPFWAYVALEQVVHLIGFAGMYWLLRDHLPGRLPQPLRLALAFTFACLPFYVIHEASVSAQAAVGWSLLHLYRGVTGRKRRLVFVVLASYPFVSVLPTAGAFVIAVAGVATSFVCARERRWHRDVWLGLGLLVLVYCVIDFAFVRTMLLHDYVTHREEWHPKASWSRYFSMSSELFLYGNYHAASAPPICLTALAMTLVGALFRRSWLIAKWVGACLLVLFLLAFTPHFVHTPPFQPLLEHFTLLRITNIRTYWCAAPVCIFGFAFAMEVWWCRWRWKIPALVFMVVEFCWILDKHVETEPELSRNYMELVARAFGKNSGQVTYDEFVAAPVYEQVQRYIGKPQSSYRILSVNLDPARAAFNGFYSADGYHNNYPLAYKARFRRAIAANLERDNWSRRRYDNWGSRVYAFVPQAGKAGYRPSNRIRTKPIRDFSLKRKALKDLGVEYVLASAPIREAKGPKALQFLRSFTADGIPLEIHLYRVR